MGPLRGKSTEDTDFRPSLAVIGVVAGVAGIQVALFSTAPGISLVRFVVELLLVPVPLLGSFALAGLRDAQAVWRPLYAGTLLVGIYAVTDALDEVVVQPDIFALVFEDGMLLVGSLALVLGAVRWTARRDAREEDLRRRNERLDQFAQVVTHDLRNPLNVAQMRLELAREGHGNEHLSTVADAHDRMEALIQDVLQLARSGETVGETEPIGLASVAASAVANTSLNAASLTVEADAELQADPGRLTAVFENLFRNSVEHADSGVHVRVGPLEDGFFVEDDGPGIPPEEHDRIFESGYTTDPEGTGLGLAIVSGVADAHGWSVRATTGESGGARFEFRDVVFADEVSTSASRQ
ncbi:HAMP domain-containing histidine kinase [Haloferax mediterranei ATCC 33500]|uniref:histidine kinase n=1 Tax=Haloferax mediterranei (strain ATCC 33500 / DSM 1411 / JCM 8866 / NBRC 14739 / NCIMB 2177 / R-4) TaxID=523841 RepID=I3R4M0_HALMT|nr:HAMP domain-containing sensor histidine kinase [Haloferax mediterranei]AFK19180.1 putative signal-transducing histidine kinase / two-component system, OmpR family, sensor histidine kinase RstB [Haloferax mediterranei ATCC 33500]AHZ21457.1 histidine kinase [Haloferax mediterranei ATCC 33500]EMA03917.1 putative signal-transducing histidine kinase / two-component system, OmpR family, sensor histidine kinase RstB [Haloferax mediterranei ATCC 33500]MDX5989279.1 HAMP domain-containing sensor histi